MSFLLIISLPLLLALALLSLHMRRIALSFAPWAALPALGVLLQSDSNPPVLISGLLLGTYLGLDATARIFLVFTAVLWTCAGVYAQAYVAHDDGKHRFFAFFLLTMSGNLGLIFAQDMVSFYLFFALMTFAAYGLVVHEKSEEAYRAGKVYIVLAVFGEVLLVTGLMLIAAATDNFRLPTTNAGYATAPMQALIIALIFFGFGIKAGVIPLHVWLPLAHPVAPTPASAVLSGAMIKAGLLGWIRFLPLGQNSLPAWSEGCIVLGLCSAFYGVLVGLTQHNPKTILAYSSISQMGFLTIGVGLGLAAPEAWSLLLPAVCLYALHHGLAKGALFLGVGVANTLPANPWSRRLLFVGLLLPALALAGAPLTSGAVAKAALKEGLHFAPAPWSSWLKTLLALAALSTTLIMGRFLFVLQTPLQSGKHYVPSPGLIFPWIVSLVAVAIITWLYVPGEFSAAVEKTLTFATTWPVLLGVVLTGVVWWGSLTRRLSCGWQIPPGDILATAGWVTQRLGRLSNVFVLWLKADRPSSSLRRWSRLLNVDGLVTLESLFRWWDTAALVFVLLIVTLYLSLR